MNVIYEYSEYGTPSRALLLNEHVHLLHVHKVASFGPRRFVVPIFYNIQFQNRASYAEVFTNDYFWFIEMNQIN